MTRCRRSVRFDSIHRMEEQMFERVLGRSVSREVETASGLTRITFRIAS